MNRPHKDARPTRRLRLRPTLDRLEGRALMAYAGHFDPTFGGFGYQRGTINAGTDNTNAFRDQASVAVEPDESVVVAVTDVTSSGVETFAVSHYKVDGTLDTSFGTSGKADIALPVGTYVQGGPTSFLVQSDGKILLVAPASTNASSFQDLTETVVARLNVDGSADTNFGTGGVEILDQATLGVERAVLPYAALQSNGEIVLTGNSSSNGMTTDGDPVAVVRLLAGGTVDTTFGLNGLATFSDVPANDDLAGESSFGVGIEPNGQIVVLASVDTGPFDLGENSVPILIRLNANGIRDTSISQVGITSSGLAFPSNNGLIVQPNGQLLLLGTSIATPSAIPVLARINLDGSLDKSVPLFGETALVTGFALQPNGEIALSYTYFIGPEWTSGFEAFRLKADLTPDASFGTGGLAYAGIPIVPEEHEFDPQGVAVDQLNRIILVGDNSPSNDLGAFTPPTQYSVIRLTATGPSAVPGDFDGDGISDRAVYVPSLGEFVIADSSGATTQTIHFGVAGTGQTIPAPGNYYGTGQDDIAAYLPAYGAYAIQDPTGQTTGIDIPFGIPGAGQTIPAPADYYATGQDDIAVFLAQSATFAILDPTGKTPGEIVPFGMPGIGNSIPAPGDYDDSGHDEIAVYLPILGAFAYRSGYGHDVIVPFGMPGIGKSIPVPGDYDGSGRTEFAVYIPSLDKLIYRPATGGPDVAIPFGIPGAGNTLPAPGDYDGSGRTEVGAYLPSLGIFAYRPALHGSDVDLSIGKVGSGQTIPVTTVVPSPFPGTGPGAVSAASINASVALGEPDPLDFVFLPTTAAKKSKPGDPPAA